ncbi:polyprotein-like, partial [Trifolium medium]|nr:polyprotein-like [Trifolium medium]
SHEKFHHPNPLWENKEFFIQLPFKLNEDVNPTKATHPGMSPSDYALAKEECNQLLRQGLIEPTKSEWACQAFYVEKRSERLGIDPKDRYKTAFCIPNAQYQWTILPFGLKVAPSLFQKVMTRIFEPILNSILIYIDDVQTDPKLAKHTSQLSLLLKKNPPPWGTKQTEVVKALKNIAQAPPALKIPGDEKRILQTDANDCYWGAVLIEEVGNNKYYCGHASGQFKEAEKHYHTTYKEALAVKLGIKKFDFHLRGFHFEVHMDNSSFPKILEFKNKMPPDPKTLLLKD